MSIYFMVLIYLSLAGILLLGLSYVVESSFGFNNSFAKFLTSLGEVSLGLVFVLVMPIVFIIITIVFLIGFWFNILLSARGD